MSHPVPEMSPRAIDVHQHLWPTTLIDALRARSKPPRLKGWTLELASEPAHIADPRDHDPALRAAQAAEDGCELVLVSLSSALGIEDLPPGEAIELLDAYHEGVLELPAPFGGWAAACLTKLDPGAVERELDRGFAGLELPATALRDANGYARAAELLKLLEERDRPLFIHPGPAGAPTAGDPDWWSPLVDYVQQMHAAWYAFRAHGRPAHPRLRVCFALLAGLAPLHGERFTARTGERTVVDEDAFLETSSYGTRAIDATVRVLGVEVLVNGSDRPYARPALPGLGEAVLAALRRSNPLRLLHSKEEDEEVTNVLDVAARAQS